MMFKSAFACAPALATATILVGGSLSSATDAVADGRYYDWGHHHYYGDGYYHGGYRAYSGYRRDYDGPYARRHYYHGGYSGYYPGYEYGDRYPYYRGYGYPYYRAYHDYDDDDS